MAPTPLLATKLYAPPVRQGGVSRPALVARLEEGARHRLTLVAAPAGFGKSSLVAEWIARTSIPVAWLSLEEDDREPFRFLAYLIAALQTLDPCVGERASRSLRSAQPAPAEHVATDVLNDVAAGSGDIALVLDYLVQEVLRGQPQRVRSFLLSTSVLERMCGSLCDAVTGRHDGAGMLAELERANLFLVPLDDERHWFRYHALFADVLRAEARREGAYLPANLHARASAWFEAQGEIGEAIRHARLADDAERAARLLEGAWRTMDRAFQIPTWSMWAQTLPDEALRVRPVLAVALGWARLGEGDLGDAERWLSEAEAWLAARRSESPAVARAAHERHVTDEAAFRALPARIAAGHAYRSQATGDGAAGEAQARRAIEIAPEDDPGVRALPAGLVGLAHWARGELDEGVAAMRMGMDGFRVLGDAAASLSFTFGIAEMQIAQGRLREALRTFQEALRYAAGHHGTVLPGTAELHVGLAELLVERRDTTSAKKHLLGGASLGDEAVLPGDAGRLLAARARVEAALGDAVAAHALLDEAERCLVVGPVPDIRPTDATRARLWLAQGRLPQARAWAEEQANGGDLETSYVNQYMLLTLVRIQLASFRSTGAERPLAAARTLLDRILRAAEPPGWIGTVIEALVLKSLVDQAAGDEPGGVATVLRALRSIEAEGHHAVFVDEGPAMARLLRAAGRREAPTSQLRRLLNDLKAPSQKPRVLPDVVEPLSDRERHVLRLLRSDLTGPQLARELGMSVHTLRSHTKSIFSKLGVHGRREAVRRADQLDLA